MFERYIRGVSRLITISRPGPTAKPSGLISRKLHRTHSLLHARVLYGRAVVEPLVTERTSQMGSIDEDKRKVIGLIIFITPVFHMHMEGRFPMPRFP